MFNTLHRPQIFLIIAAVVALAAIVVVGISTYRGAVALEERRLIERVETIALSLDPREIAFLSGKDSDVRSPFYASLKKRFADMLMVSDDMRFVYLAGKREGTIFLYLDSESENSPDYSPPGEEYAEASATFHNVFETGLSRFEGPLADRWGEWVSTFAAITHPRTGERLAVLGIDVDAFEYRKHIAFAMGTPILLVVLLFMVFFVGYVRYRKEEELLYLKSEFLSVASHDLRSPLAGVLWAFEELRETKGGESRNNILANIERTLARMKENVQSILDSSRTLGLGNDTATLVSISNSMNSVVEGLMFAAHEHDVHIAIDKSLTQPVFTHASSEKIRHIFSNLISNAIKYSRPGGSVDIRHEKEGDCHIISVEDRGIGIPEKDQSRVFSPRFHARNAGEAHEAGLGLYFTKRLVDECGGRIWFVSEENVGTTFYVEFLAANPPRASKDTRTKI